MIPPRFRLRYRSVSSQRASPVASKAARPDTRLMGSKAVEHPRQADDPRTVGDIAARSVTFVLLAAIQAYRFAIRPFLGGACKFHPHCSEFAVEAISVHGPVRGLALAVRRLARCRPFSVGGYDPVPPKSDSQSA